MERERKINREGERVREIEGVGEREKDTMVKKSRKHRKTFDELEFTINRLRVRHSTYPTDSFKDSLLARLIHYSKYRTI